MIIFKSTSPPKVSNMLPAQATLKVDDWIDFTAPKDDERRHKKIKIHLFLHSETKKKTI